MARTFKVHERAPHRPNRCVVTHVTGSTDNPLIDLDTQIDYYGMVYLSYSTLAAVADQLGFAGPNETKMLRAENEELKKRLDRIPAVTERLVNDIRDISISATADLLSESAPIVLADDTNNEQSNTRANLDNLGDDKPSEDSSEPVVNEGSASIPASDGIKRKPGTKPRTSSSGN
jgi:hypothetical protein|tara:strand:- start:6262 stop:6786 length:525 start_codon:yes stop_codon:yes gene_type:complete